MATRPSAPLLALLRDTSKKKGLNTAALAQAANIDRKRLKHVLTGREPLTVDELIQISEAMEIGPEDLGMAIPDVETDTTEATLESLSSPEECLEPNVNPYGNHAEQILQVGFALGCDVFFLVDGKQLEGTGVPKSIQQRFADQMPIRLEAAYHRHNDPKYLPEGLQVRLSFDAVYTCTFSWSSIRQITLFPAPPSEPEPPEVEEEQPPMGGHLRLVK